MARAPFLMGLMARAIPAQMTIQRVDWLKLHIFILTYISYMAYHASRKPLSVVKTSKAFLDCANEDDIIHIANDSTCRSWISDIDGKPSSESNVLLGSLDTSYLFAYAIGIFISGYIAERVNLRYFLTVGQVASGALAILYGLAYTFDIHSMVFFVSVLVAQGLFQSTGWPGLVPIMGSWFGKAKRGLIMGLWNTHTSVGNIVGTLIAGAFVNTNWGLSFIVPGILIAAVGLLFFFALVPSPEDLQLKVEDEEEEGVVENAEAGKEKEKEEEDGHVVEAGHEDKAISLLGALRIPGVVEFSLCLFFAKLVRCDDLKTDWLYNGNNYDHKCQAFGSIHSLNPDLAKNLNSYPDPQDP